MTKKLEPGATDDATEDVMASSGEADDAVIGVAFRWSLLGIGGLLVVAAGVVWWLNRPEPKPETHSTPLVAPEVRTVKAEIPQVTFTDITEAAGIDFNHTNGAAGQKLLPETMGGGCAFFDYDNDSDQDLLLINSCHWPGQQPADSPPPTMGLYQNDGKGKFTNVTAGSGLDQTFYGMGVAIGDYDNDGWSDVFISAVGGDHLFHNEQGQGKFAEVTEQAGVAGGADAWSTSCGFFDYNNDGRLDLFVCNYVRWSAEIDLKLERTLDGVNRAYLPPTAFEGAFPSLFRNDGGGKFTDVSAAAGIQVKNPSTGVPLAKSLGVVFVDFDRDGWTDIAVANDTVQNLLFHNAGDGTFKEIGALAGIAFDINGQSRGAMGVDAANFRNNDDLGLVIGNFANEMTALYVTQGSALSFADEAIATGLGPASRLELTFGLFFWDYDLDGRQDVFAANGHLEDDIRRIQQSQSYEQPPHLFWNAGPDADPEFPAVSAEKAGEEMFKPMVGRGATYADIDADGDLDVLVTSSGGRPRLLRNDQDSGHHWLRLKLTAAGENRDALGARIEVHAGENIQRRFVSTTRSYMSQTELPLTFGLGRADKVAKVVVHWPDGSREEFADLAVDRVQELRQITLQLD